MKSIMSINIQATESTCPSFKNASIYFFLAAKSSAGSPLLMGLHIGSPTNNRIACIAAFMSSYGHIIG
jgi:hypothetical protein